MSYNETYRNTLTYAFALVGDERLLAERLGAKVPQILNWTSGVEPVPPDIFLKAVDVVLAASAEQIAASKHVLAKLKLNADSRTIDALRRGALFDATTPTSRRDPKPPSDNQQGEA